MDVYTAAVSVANVWTHPEAPRKVDQMMLSKPVRIRAWLDSLPYGARLELCTANLIQTQVLFGEEVLVLEERDGWASVVIPGQPSAKDDRGYPGWMPKANLAKKPDTVGSIRRHSKTDRIFIYRGKNERARIEFSHKTCHPG